MQDVQLGLLVAIMPMLAGAENALPNTKEEVSILANIVGTLRLVLWLTLGKRD